MAIALTGIDEAGYGPLLGPMALVAVSAEAGDLADLCARCAAKPLGIADSKQIHTPGNLAPLESVALAAIAWSSGRRPETAADCFAMLGEGAEERSAAPWMQGAGELRLPVAAADVPRWRIDGVRPRGMIGRLVHPRSFNRAQEDGGNRHLLELEELHAILHLLPPSRCSRRIDVDRLGGRRYYGDYLGGVWPQAQIEVLDERPACSSYLVRDGRRRHHISFAVDGEGLSPLTAMASCIAKYARELHMLLLNRFWCGLRQELRPTAGYHRDARRWLEELGTAAVDPYRLDLIRPVIGAADAGD